jgi:PAS domain S-box-containing protein
VSLAICILYETSVASQLTRLSEIVVSRARLLETMARYDAVQSPHAPHGPLQVTLDQIKETERFYVGFGRTGGFSLARLEGDQIVFIVRRLHGPDDALKPILLDSSLAEPMRRALTGRSGSMIGPDYRGEMVVAAYEPLPDLGLGMVAKIDLAEIREPYLKAGLYALAATVAVVLLGALVLWRLSGPVVRRLEESEERFRFIFEQAPLGVTIVGPDLGVIRSNAEFARLVGRRVEEMPGLAIADLTHPEDREASLARSQDLLQGLVGSNQIDKRYLRPDGSVVWGRLTARLHRDRQGNPAYIISLVEDITEHKKTLEELELSRRTAQTLIDTTEDTILLLDAAGLILACNQAWANRAGVRVEEVVGTHLNQHIPADMTGQREARGRQAMATGEVVKFEDRFAGRYFDYHLHPVPDPGGGYSRVAVYARDITRRKQAEAEREALIASLQEALAKVRTLSGLLPICSSCKKIRNDQGYWEQLESYFASHAGAEFTHGICPQCVSKLYPELTDPAPAG